MQDPLVQTRRLSAAMAAGSSHGKGSSPRGHSSARGEVALPWGAGPASSRNAPGSQFSFLGKIPPGTFVKDPWLPSVFRVGAAEDNMLFFSLVGRSWGRVPIFKCVRGEDDGSRYYLYNDDTIGRHGGWIIAVGGTSLPIHADMRALEPRLRLRYWGDDAAYEDPSRPGLYTWEKWVRGEWKELEEPLEHTCFPECDWDELLSPRHMELIVMGQ